MSSAIQPPSSTLYGPFTGAVGTNSLGGLAASDSIQVNGQISTLNTTGPPVFKAARLVGEIVEARRYYTLNADGSTRLSSGTVNNTLNTTDLDIPAANLPVGYDAQAGNAYAAFALGPDQDPTLGLQVFGLTANSTFAFTSLDQVVPAAAQQQRFALVPQLTPLPMLTNGVYPIPNPIGINPNRVIPKGALYPGPGSLGYFSADALNVVPIADYTVPPPDGVTGLITIPAGNLAYNCPSAPYVVPAAVGGVFTIPVDAIEGLLTCTTYSSVLGAEVWTKYQAVGQTDWTYVILAPPGFTQWTLTNPGV